MASTDLKKWFAKVKYYNGDVEDILVRKIKTQEGNQFSPNNYKDFDANVLYSVKTSMKDVEGKEQRYYAFIGKLAGSLEELNNSDKRISWPTWPSDIHDEPENSSQDEKEQKNTASSSIAAYREKAALQKSKRRAKTTEECQKFLHNYSIKHKSLNEICDLSGQITISTGYAINKCSQDKETFSDDQNQSNIVFTFEELKSLLDKTVQTIEETIENRSTIIEGRLTEVVKKHFVQACENTVTKMEEMLKNICNCGGRHSANGIDNSDIERKVNLGSGFYCTHAGFAAMEEAKNDCDWAIALLVGVFGEDAKLMRMYPRKQGLKKFPLSFLMLAQNLYRERLKHNDCEDDIDEMVKSLPAYLSDRALDLGGGRGTSSREKRSSKRKTTHTLRRTEKRTGSSAVLTAKCSTDSSTLQKPLQLQEKMLVKQQDAVLLECNNVSAI